jgi:hypothetical protein
MRPLARFPPAWARRVGLSFPRFRRRHEIRSTSDVRLRSFAREHFLQLDKTRIVIRERNYLDLMDLGLRVLRAHAGPLLITSLLGAAPMIAMNVWLLSSFAEELVYSQGEDWFGNAMGYTILTSFLIIWQMPMASALTTLYLGHAVFQERPSARQIAREFFRALPQLILCQVILRGMLIPWVVTWFVLFCVWPYLNEIILLEKNPLRSRGPTGLSTFGRSSLLHSANSGELFGRWFMAGIGGFFWVLALWLTAWYFRGHLAGRWAFDWSVYTIYLQLVIWFVLSYFTVVRFLSYLDLRIKSEGWEVELRLRAEAAKLARQWN